MMTMDDLDEDDKARLQRYMEGEYTPSKKLVEIAEVDPFWETLVVIQKILGEMVAKHCVREKKQKG